MSSPPQTGERAGVRGKDEKGNSYITKLNITLRTLRALR